MSAAPQRESTIIPAAPAAQFTTTHWSVVLAAREPTKADAAQALERLCRTYWRPLYVFTCRQGHNTEDAQDLTQEFFTRLVAKNYLNHVHPEKGRFRSFLLAAMKHFLANEWDRAKSLKRGGDCTFVPWDDATIENQVEAGSFPDLPAEKLYDRQWTLTLLDQVFVRLRDECKTSGKVELFDVLQNYLSGEKVGESYADVAAQLNMSPGAVQVAVHRLRRRYGELVRMEIAHTVGRPEDIDEEIRHLFSALRD